MKKIYVAVANKVRGGESNRKIILQPSYRQMAQAIDAVSKLRGFSRLISPGETITTIALQARDSAELSHLNFMLQRYASIPELDRHLFYDYNPELYLTEDSIPTAFAVVCDSESQAHGILNYLPLWGDE